MAERYETMAPEGQPTASAGGWGSSIWGNIGGALSDAVNIYASYEKAKAIKNTTGRGQNEQANTMELDNGAAVLVDAPKKQPTQQPVPTNDPLVFGIPQSKLLMGSLALLGLGLVLRAVK